MRHLCAFVAALFQPSLPSAAVLDAHGCARVVKLHGGNLLVGLGFL